MTTAMDKYRATVEFVKQQKREAQALVREAFNEGAQAMLDEISAESFSWWQFTPWFNDGDACVFRVHADTDYGLEIDGVGGDKKVSYNDKSEAAELIRARYSDVSHFVYSFDADDLLFMFGDHVKVTVTRNGVTTEEWEHE